MDHADSPAAGESVVSIALVLAIEGAPAGVETGIRFHTPDAAATKPRCSPAT